MSSVTVEINGRETVSQAALAAKNGISSLRGETESFTSSIAKAVAPSAAVVAALFSLGKVAIDTFNEFAAQERSVAQFNAAMTLSGKISKDGAESLRKYADEMSVLTGQDDEAILSMEAFLASAGRNETQIRKLISAAADYSAATGKDMRQAVEELNKTFSGTEGKIGNLIPALKGLTDEQLRAGIGVEVVAKQYAGFASQMSGIADIQLKNLTNAWEDLRAAFGANAAAALSPFLQWLTDMANGWAKAGQEKAAYYDIKQPADDVAEVTARGNIRRVVDQLELAYLAQRMAKTTGSREDISSTDSRVVALQKELDKWIFNLEKIQGRWAETTTKASGTTPSSTTKWTFQELFGGYKVGSGVMGQSGIPGRLGVNIPLGNESNIRDDLESYGWTAEMLAAPLIEFRDDLESYGWSSEILLAPLMGFRDDLESYGWNSAMLAKPLIEFRDDLESYGWTSKMLLKPVQEFRDDLESYGWDELFLSILPELPTEGGGFRAQGQSTIAGPVSGGGRTAAQQIRDNMSFGDHVGEIFNQLSGGLGSAIQSLGMFQAILDPIGTIISGAMEVLGPLMETVLQPIVGVLRVLGQVLAAFLIPQLEIMGPVIKFLAEGFVWLYNNALRYLANGVISIMNILSNSVLGLANGFINAYNAIRWIWGGAAVAALQYRALDQGWLGAITLGTLTTAGASSGTTTAATGTAATYEKPRDITINVQINTAALVGSGGISDFAAIIGRELRSLGVLNMAAT